MRRMWLLLLALACLPACDDDSSGDDTLAVVGTYVDNFMGEHAITEESWTQTGDNPPPMGGRYTNLFHLVSFDNEARYTIGHNDADNDFSGEMYSRFDWVNHDGVLYFCQSVFDAASEDAAKAATAPDATDPATKGCGVSDMNADGFPWSTLTAQ